MWRRPDNSRAKGGSSAKDQTLPRVMIAAEANIANSMLSDSRCVDRNRAKTSVDRNVKSVTILSSITRLLETWTIGSATNSAPPTHPAKGPMARRATRYRLVALAVTRRAMKTIALRRVAPKSVSHEPSVA